mmetsp:Transcript_33375/g.50352  ORF Transcript_33375/g.50352 Transcript_33375/m.50352 type:complete len:283 (+) Transcript_33375:37-885(+)
MNFFTLCFFLVSCSLCDASWHGMNHDKQKIIKHYKLGSILPSFALIRGGDKSSSRYQQMVEDMSKSKEAYKAAAEQLKLLVNRTREMDERTSTARSGLEMDLLRLTIPLTCLPPELVTNQLRELRNELVGLKNLTEPMQDKLQQYLCHVEECLELTLECLIHLKRNEKKVTSFLKKKGRLNHGQMKRLERNLHKDLSVMRDTKQSISDELRTRDNAWTDYVHHAKMVKDKAVRIDEMLRTMREKKEQQKQESATALKDFYKVNTDNELQEVEVEMTTYVFSD